MAHDPKLTGNTCRCAACGEYFRSPKGFDRHRVGPHNARHCLTPRELAALGYTRDDRFRWLKREPAKVPALAEA